MDNPIKRFFKPNAPARSVDLAVLTGTIPVQSAKCEIIEYDSATGMEQWNDSIFMQDFEDFVLSVPAPLTLAGHNERQNKISPDLTDISDVLSSQPQ